MNRKTQDRLTAGYDAVAAQLSLSPLTPPRSRPKYRVTIEQLKQLEDDFSGLCSDCGCEQGGVEPDAQDIECEGCGEAAVQGSDNILYDSRFEVV